MRRWPLHPISVSLNGEERLFTFDVSVIFLVLTMRPSKGAGSESTAAAYTMKDSVVETVTDALIRASNSEATVAMEWLPEGG